MKTQRILCTTLLTLLPLAGHAQTPPPLAPPVALTMKFTPGEVQRYTMTMNMDMTMSMAGQGAKAPAAIPAIHQQMVMAYDTTVQSVNPADGSATILEHITQMTSTMNGQPVPGMDAITGAYKDGFTITMSPSGKMLSMKMPPSALPAGMELSKMGSLAPNALPTSPVRVGDSWGGDADMSPILGQIPGAPAMKMSVQSTLAGIETGAQTIANIRQTYSGTLGGATPAGAAGAVQLSGKFTGIGLMKFDVTGGSIASQDSTITMNMTTALPNTPAAAATTPQTMKMQMQMTTHLVRLPANAPAP